MKVSEVLCAVAVLYMFGFVVVMVLVASGYQGGDLLTEHYRSVLQLIFR